MDVWITVGGIAIIIVVAVWYYRRYLARRAAAIAGPCGLFTDWIFPDECLGTCPPIGGAAQSCTVVTTRPYFGGLARQAASCSCPVPPAGGGGAGPLGGGGKTPGG